MLIAGARGTRQSTGTSCRCFSVFAVLGKELSASAAASPFPPLGKADGFTVATGQRVARSPAGFCWAADKGKRGTRHISLSVSPTGKYLRNKNAQNMLCAIVTSKAQGL